VNKNIEFDVDSEFSKISEIRIKSGYKKRKTKVRRQKRLINKKQISEIKIEFEMNIKKRTFKSFHFMLPVWDNII